MLCYGFQVRFVNWRVFVENNQSHLGCSEMDKVKGKQRKRRGGNENGKRKR